MTYMDTHPHTEDTMATEINISLDPNATIFSHSATHLEFDDPFDAISDALVAASRVGAPRLINIWGITREYASALRSEAAFEASFDRS